MLAAWTWVFPLSVWLLAIGWSWQLAQWLLNIPRLANLNRVSLPILPASLTPQLTVVVPACNEEESIEATLRSLLASEQIRLQIVAVDDRSTDQTGEIMERIAVQILNNHLENALQVIHIDKLSPNWLGKPHALATAASLAQSDWILFTDGDVLFAPQALNLALRYALAEEVDHLVLMPDWITRTHGEAAMHGAMHALSAWTMRLWRISDPKTRDFLGVGAFNLVRRSTYEALGGFSALRMEVLEDLRFGWKLKRAGYRQRVVLGPGLAAVRWSQGAWGVVRNLEKNLFALYRYRTFTALFACFGLLIQIAWPILGIAAGGWARAAGILTYAAIAGLFVASRRVTRVAPGYAVFFPVAAGLFLFAHLRSISMTLLRGGVVWRGTHYSLRELRAHAGRLW